MRYRNARGVGKTSKPAVAIDRVRTDRSEAAAAGEIYYDFGSTSVAALLVGVANTGVVAIVIRERPNAAAMLDTLRTRFEGNSLVYAPEKVSSTMRSVIDFVEHPKGNLDLKLDIRGTDFQQRVYAAVLNIPFGHTTSFARIADIIGTPRAVRAVGNACTKNPLEFAIPCHRVLRSDGTFSGGSAWGDKRQAAIVERERVALSRLAREE